MWWKTLTGGLCAALVSVSLVGPASGAPSGQSIDQFVSQARSQKLIKKSESGKARALARSVCKSSASLPDRYWPSATKTAIADQRSAAWWGDRELNVNRKTMRTLIGLALTTACPRTLVTMEVPTDGWQEVEPSQFFTTYKSRVTEGALLPLGNSWQLGGELTGYVASGTWYEGAYFTLEMLDANFQPVIANYVGVRDPDSKDTEIVPSRPKFDNPILQDSEWIGGYSPGQDYSASGVGSDAQSLESWANARYARVKSITNDDDVLITLRVDPQRWVLVK